MERLEILRHRLVKRFGVNAARTARATVGNYLCRKDHFPKRQAGMLLRSATGNVRDPEADTAEFALGKAAVAKPDGEERLAQQHAAFVENVERCADSTGLSAVLAVHRFVARSGVAELKKLAEIDGGDNVTFAVDGKVVVDLTAVQA